MLARLFCRVGERPCARARQRARMLTTPPFPKFNRTAVGGRALMCAGVRAKIARGLACEKLLVRAGEARPRHNGIQGT